MSENGLTWEVLEQIPVAIVAVREDGEITFVNLRAEALFGYSRAELLGDSIHRLVPDRFAGQHADFLRGFLAAPRARPMGAGRVLFARRKDGSEFPAEIALNPLQTAGGAITLSFIRDLTLRLRAEAQMRLQATALESSADGIVITDRGGRITWANPAFSQLTGYSLEEVLGQNPRLLKSGAHDESFYASMWAEILAGRVWRGETVNRHKDGRLYVEEQTITPVRGEHHEITHFIAIKHDITARKQAETALERERAYLEALHDVSLGLLARRDLNELLEDLVKRAGELVGSDSGFLDLVDAETGQLRPTVGTGALRESLRHPVARGEGLAGRVWETGKPLIVDDYDTWPGRVAGFRRQTIRATIGVPLQSGAEVAGVLGLSHGHATRLTFGDAELQLLTRFAQLASLALDNARLYRDAVRMAERRGSLFRASRETGASRSRSEICAAVHRAVAGLMAGDDFLVAVLDEGGRTLQPIYESRPNGSLDGGPAWAEHVLRSGESWRGSAARTEGTGPAEPGNGGLPGVSILAAPLRLRGQTLGLMAVRHAEAKAYSADDQEVLELLAGQTAAALENARLFEAVTQLAITDVLTGIANRRHFFELAQHEFERARRYPHPLSAVMLDVDRFKKINDTYGHAVGDQVLRAVAERCRQSLREIDVLGRYGGEEFAIVLPETEPERAQQVAERLRQQVAQLTVHAEAGAVPVTISLGVAWLDPEVRTLDALLERADQAMYAAKLRGRNRVLAWNPDHIRKTGPLSEAQLRPGP